MDLNKVILIGRLGQMDIKTLPSGNLVCNLSVVTNTKWKNKNGEIQNKAEWHRIVIFDPNIISYCEKFLSIGDTLHIEGRLSYREHEVQGNNEENRKIKIPEIVIGKFDGLISIFKKKRTDDNTNKGDSDSTNDDEEIPFDI